MVSSKFGIKFVPHVVIIGATRDSCGRRHRIKFCHDRNRGRMDIVLPSGTGIKVRYIKGGGLMYAGCVNRPVLKAVVRAANQLTPLRSLGGMLANLTAIEAANRANALAAHRG